MTAPTLPVPRLQYRWEKLPVETLDRDAYPGALFQTRCYNEFIIPTPGNLRARRLSEDGDEGSLEYAIEVSTNLVTTGFGHGPCINWMGEPTPTMPYWGLLEPEVFGNAPLFVIGPTGLIWSIDLSNGAIHSELIYTPPSEEVAAD